MASYTKNTPGAPTSGFYSVNDLITDSVGTIYKVVRGGPAAPENFIALDGETLDTGAGTGITAGANTIYKTSVTRKGNIVETQILIDLTDLHSEATDLDIIGVDASSNAAHIGQITAAQNGTILGGIVRCLEVPAGGDPNIAFYFADEATGVEDQLITALTSDTVMFDPNADWTIDMARSITGIPGADKYLYMVQGDATGTDADYTAGKFLITLYGYDA